jgi:hypothetical protein
MGPSPVVNLVLDPKIFAQQSMGGTMNPVDLKKQEEEERRAKRQRRREKRRRMKEREKRKRDKEKKRERKLREEEGLTGDDWELSSSSSEEDFTSSDEDSDDSFDVPASQNHDPHKVEKKTLKAHWIHGRANLKKLTIVDTVLALIWIVESAYLFFGGVGLKCKSSNPDYNGWCGWWNFGLASSVLLAVCLLISAGVGMRDLSKSKHLLSMEEEETGALVSGAPKSV